MSGLSGKRKCRRGSTEAQTRTKGVHPKYPPALNAYARRGLSDAPRVKRAVALSFTCPMHRCSSLWFRAPDGSVVTIAREEEHQALRAGYEALTPAEVKQAQTIVTSDFADINAVRECLATAPPDYSRVLAGVESAIDSLGIVEPDAFMLARIYRFEDEHPTAAIWAELAPWGVLWIVGGFLAGKLLWRIWWRLVRAVVREARGAWRG